MARAREIAVLRFAALDPRRGLCLGFLAMLPLFFCYELAQNSPSIQARNLAEVLLGMSFEALGPSARYVRRALLVLAAGVAWWSLRARAVRLWPALARVWLEGSLGALVMGPLLIASARSAESWFGRADLSWDPGPSVPELAQAGLVAGGAAWEELVFRVGVYGAVAAVLGRLFALAKAPSARARPLGRSAQLGAHLGAGVCSALAFTAFHLRSVRALFGSSGNGLEPALAWWTFSAGLALAGLFFWRGVGVAAWTHALFNLTLWVGIDPDQLA